MLARVADDWAGEAHIRAAGLALLAAGLCLFVIGVRVFAARRAVPGERRRWYKDPAQWHGITDTAWLGLDAITLAVAAVAVSGGRGTDVPVDAERHIVGAGFVTLLIFGEGANLLPGFARCPHHDIGRIGSRQQT